MSTASSRSRRASRGFVFVAVALLSFSIAGAGKAEGEADQPVPSHGWVALAGLDPVLLLAGEELQGEESIDLVHGPYRYIFTTAKHRARFQAEPDRYRIQGDGTCPVYPGIGAHPYLFAVHQGRIYAFSSRGARERFLAKPDRYLDAAGQPLGFRNARKVAILLYDAVEAVDVAIPGEVFQVAGRDGSFRTFTVAASTRAVRSQGFLDMLPAHTFEDSPAPDVLIIPGGGVEAVVRDPDLIAWVQKAAQDADVVLGLSTGAYILARAGLLDGLEATTHSGAVDRFRHFAQRTTVVTGRPYVDTGKVVTSPGGARGLDASLHVLARLAGAKPARDVAGYLAHPWQPEPAAAP